MSFSFDYQNNSSEEAGSSQQRTRQQPGSACEECRRKKFRCDRVQPTCTACSNSGVTCVMRGSVPSRGPKKGHLKALRDQIAALESRLNEQDNSSSSSSSIHQRQLSHRTSSNGDEDGNAETTMEMPNPSIGTTSLITGSMDFPPWSTTMSNAMTPIVPLQSSSEAMSRSLIIPSLERIPVAVHLTPMICSDLDQLYFDRAYSFAPMLQKYRYLSWSRSLNKTKERLCLQYTMWTLAAALSSQFQSLRRELYGEARQLLDALDLETNELSPRPIEQVQAWLLLSLYEFMSDLYQRGLVSAGRAFRLIQLMRLHEIDRLPVTSGQGDLIDIESNRRTFWIAYTIDRFTSVNDNLPLAFNEHEIRTRLPAPNSQFMSGRPTTMCFLTEVITEMESDQQLNHTNDLIICPFTQSIILATICGRTYGLKKRFLSDHPFQDVIPELYRRHQTLQTLITARIKVLSMQISSTSEHPDSMLIFLTLAAYMVVFMLCETAQLLPMGSEEPHSLLTGHRHRSLDAVHELDMFTSMLTQANHFQLHPFTPLPLGLIAKYCLDHIGTNDAYSNLVLHIARALESLTSVNSLAQGSLRMLGMTVPVGGLELGV